MNTAENVRLKGAPPLTAAEFTHLWSERWHFKLKGQPEDVAAYLWEVLLAISKGVSDEEMMDIVGGQDGLQDFVFQWLTSAGLLTETGLSPEGERILASFEEGVHYSAFGR